MHIAIVDDNQDDIHNLEQHLENYCHEHQIYSQISTFTDAGTFLSSFTPDQYELIFLDIFIDEANGIKLAQKIRSTGCHSSIIFTTTSQDFALDASHLHALDYLIKPIDYEDLESSLSYLDSFITPLAFTRYHIKDWSCPVSYSNF